MTNVNAGSTCATCGARLAHDHEDTMCSPCRRALIEKAAHHEALIARKRDLIKQTFEESGLYGVAHRFACDPAEALDVLIRAGVLPFASARRRQALERIVSSSRTAHVALAKELNISRWTVATYRRQLGIEPGAIPFQTRSIAD
jgi:hypothetical protein